MLQINAVPARTMGVLKFLFDQPVLHSRFFLVGGTGLALHLGHRISADIDLFSDQKNDLVTIQNILLGNNAIKLKGTTSIALFLEVKGVKVDILNYPYPFIEEPFFLNNILVAGIKDIAPMKLKTILNRGSKRDFYDLFFLLQQFSLSDLISFFKDKYKSYEPFILFRSITYFDDAESDNDPILLKEKNLTWSKVKRTIIAETKKLI